VRSGNRLLSFALPVAVCLAWASVGLGQEASADQAKAALQQGLDQYKTLDFKAAQATLLKVDRNSLSDAEKKTLDEYLGKVPEMLRKQAAARDSMSEAEKALAGNDLAKAKAGFASAVAASELLPAEERDKAAKQLALVEEKMKVASAAPQPAAPAKPPAAPAKPPAAPAKPPAAPAKPDAAAAAAAAAKADAEAKAKADADAKKLLADMQARRAKVQELIEAGQLALDNNEPEKAVGYFQRALVLDPQSTEAGKLLDYARRQTATSGGVGILNRMAERIKIAKEAVSVDFESAMKHSQEALAGADTAAAFDKAANDARVARNILESNKSLYPAEEYRAKIIEADSQLKWVEQKRSDWEKASVKKQIEEMKKAEAVRQVREEERRQKRIASLSDRAKALRAERKYEEAVAQLEEVLKLDPKNRWAAEWKEYLEQEVVLSREGKLFKTRLDEEQKTILDVREAEIPWYELLRYPRDWKDITARREGIGASTSAESDVERQIRNRLKAKITKLDFEEIEFKDVIQWLRDVSGLSFNVKWPVLALAGIEKTTPVTAQLADVPLETALNVILGNVGGGTAALTYVLEEGVITISTKEDLSGPGYRTTRVYDIRDLIVRVPNFKGPRIDISQVGQQAGQNVTAGGGGGGGRGLFDEQADTGAAGAGRGERAEEMKTRTELINDIMRLIQTTIDPTSWRTAGGEVGAISELNGQFIITQTAKNHADLMTLITQLREARTLQIAIEARFITVQSGFLNRIGLDLDFYFNMGSRLGAAAGANPNRVMDPFTGATIETLTPAAGGGSIVNYHPIDAQMNNGSWNGRPANQKWTPMGVLQDSRGFISNMNTKVGGDIGANASGNGIGVAGAFLDDVQVYFLIEATQANQSSRLLTAPRITLFNGQRAYITVSTQRAYVANYEPVVAENSAALRPIVSYVPTGTVLDVEATVSADRRYVTLTVRPQVAELQLPLDEISFFIAQGQPVTIQLPTIKLQDLQTTVSVPDGGTLLLGGQKSAGEVEREMGAPILDKVPILNRFFTNRAKVRDEATLLILIKPKIIIQREEEEKAFP